MATVTRFAASLALALWSASAAAADGKPAFATPKATSLAEGFADVSELSGNGWSLQNLSAPVGSTGWFQGVPLSFDAQAGAANAYIAANYNNTGTSGTIGNWLLTPVLDFGNGATFTFWTRKLAPDTYPDRLQVRLSRNGASTAVGPGATGVGDFTDLLVDINPTLAFGVYPMAWTQYTVSHASHPQLPHSGSGRIGFRYFVTGAGFVGPNSEFIGIDTVSYSSGPPEYRIGGTVSGVVGSGLTISLDGGTPVPVGNGPYFFAPYLLDGSSYTVAVESQPAMPAQTCSVSEGSGTVDASTTVDIACVTDTFAIGGTVTGLAGSGLVLRLNGGNDFAIAADGPFAFPTQLEDLSNYAVTIAAQPGTPSQTCSVSNASGTLASADVDDVQIACVTDTFAIGGSVTGLSGSGLVLRLNGADDLPIAANGAFGFPGELDDLSNYAVTVATQPGTPSQTCSVANGDGALASADVASVVVVCFTDSYAVRGNVSGLAGSGLALRLNGGAGLAIASDGPFAFPNELPDLSSYIVTIATQPALPAQTCSVANGKGALAGADATAVAVDCLTDAFTLAVISGSPQEALPGAAFDAPLAVQLADGDGAPVPDAAVTFTAPPTGASASLDDGVQASSATLAVQTDSDGEAIVVATANGIAGCYGVIASAAGAPSVPFELTNVDPGPAVFADGFETTVPTKGFAICQ